MSCAMYIDEMLPYRLLIKDDSFIFIHDCVLTMEPMTKEPQENTVLKESHKIFMKILIRIIKIILTTMKSIPAKKPWWTGSPRPLGSLSLLGVRT